MATYWTIKNNELVEINNPTEKDDFGFGDVLVTYRSDGAVETLSRMNMGGRSAIRYCQKGGDHEFDPKKIYHTLKRANRSWNGGVCKKCGMYFEDDWRAE